MKQQAIKLIAFTVALCLLAASLPQTAFVKSRAISASSDLIEGGDFESTVISSTSEASEGWRYNNTTAADLSPKSYSGLKSVKLTTSSSTYGTFSYKTINVDKNRDYKLEFYLYVEESGSKDLRYSLMSGTKYLDGAKQVSISGAVGEWYHFETEINSGNYTDLTLQLQPYSGGVYYIDDVKMYAANDPFNSIKNGNFENGLKDFTNSTDSGFSASTENAFEGSSLKISGNGDILSQTVTLKSYTDYVFTFVSKAQNSASKYNLTANGASLIGGEQTFIGNEDYTETRIGFNTGASAEFTFSLTAGEGITYVDNIRIAEKADISFTEMTVGRIVDFPSAGYGLGETVILKAEADDGYALTGWYQGENLLETGESYRFTATDIVLTVKFSSVNVDVENNDFEFNNLSMYSVSHPNGFSISSENPANGNYSLKIESQDTAERYAWARIDIKVLKNTDYVVRFSGRRENKDNTALVKVLAGNSGLTLKYGYTSSDQYFINGDGSDFTVWGNNSFTFNSGKNEILSLAFLVNTGVAYVDDISVDKAVSVKATASEGGSISGTSSSVYGYGDTVALHAIPLADYKFDGWYSDGKIIESSLSYSFTAKKDIELTANFSFLEKNTNRVTNSGFEESLVNSYTQSRPGGFEITAETAYAGNSSLKVSAPGGEIQRYQYIRQLISVEKNTDYILSFYGKRAEENNTAIYKILDSSNNNLLGSDKFVNGSSGNYCDWGKNTTLFNSGNNDTLYIVFTVATGEAYVDELSIRKKITVSAETSEGGEISGVSASGYGLGSTITLTALSKRGLEFSGWYKDDENGELLSSSQIYQFIAQENVVIYAKYEKSSDSDNLIVNGGFERPIITAYSFAANNISGFEITDSVHRGGNYSMKISAPGQGVPKWHSINQKFEVEKNTDYILEFYGRQVNDESLSAIYKIMDSNNNNILGTDRHVKGDQEVPTEWGKNRVRFNSGDNTRLALSFVVAYYEAYVDDLSITKVPVRTEKILTANIPNSGFESSSLSDYDITDRNGFSVTCEDKYTGNSCLKIQSNQTANRYASARIMIEVDRNTEYVLRFYGRRTGRNAESAIWKIYGDNAIPDISNQYWVNGNGMNYANWGLNQLCFNSGDNEYIYLAFVVDKGVAFVDNISLAKCVRVTATAEEGGTISGAAKYYAYGDSVKLVAMSKAGYIFKGWFINNRSVESRQSYSFTATKDFAIKAGFSYDSDPLNMLINSGFEENLEYSWSPMNNSFAGFSLSENAFRGKYSLRIDSYESGAERYRYIRQTFDVKPNTEYILSFYGKREKEGASAIYKILTKDLKAVVSDKFVNGNGDKFNEWGRNCISFNSGNNTELMITFVVNNGAAYVDNIVVGERCSLSVKAGKNGSATTKSADNFALGEIIPLIAKPNVGYKVEGWYQNGRKLSAENPQDFMIKGNTELTVEFIESDDAFIKNFNPKNLYANDGKNLILCADFEDSNNAPWDTSTFLKHGVASVVELDGNKVLYFNPQGKKRQISYFKITLEANEDYMLSFNVKGNYLSETNSADMSFGIMNTKMEYLVLQELKSGMYYDETPNCDTERSMTPPAWDACWHRRGCIITTGKYTDFYIAVTGTECEAYIDDIMLCKVSDASAYKGSDWGDTVEITDYMAEKTKCDDKYNLVKNYNFKDTADGYWTDTLGFGGLLSPFSVASVDDKINALTVSQFNIQPSNSFYVKWFDIAPGTEYTFSFDALSNGDNPMFGLIAPNSKRYSRVIDLTVESDGEWHTLGITFDSGNYDKIGFYLTDSGKETSVTNIRLFKSEYGIKPIFTGGSLLSTGMIAIISATGVVVIASTIAFILLKKKGIILFGKKPEGQNKE